MVLVDYKLKHPAALLQCLQVQGQQLRPNPQLGSMVSAAVSKGCSEASCAYGQVLGVPVLGVPHT